jgi:hypothetical protein
VALDSGDGFMFVQGIAGGIGPMQVKGILRIRNQNKLFSKRIPELSIRLRGQTRIRIKTDYANNTPIDPPSSENETSSPTNGTDEPCSENESNQNAGEIANNNAPNCKKMLCFLSGWKLKWSSRKIVTLKHDTLFKKRTILLDEPAIVFFGPGAEPGSLLTLKPGECNSSFYHL